jgi:hypothetical protein
MRSYHNTNNIGKDLPKAEGKAIKKDMKITLAYRGENDIILTIRGERDFFFEEITDSFGAVDEDIVDSLQGIIDEIKHRNNELNK